MKEEEMSLPDMTVTMVFDDGKEVECEVLMIFPAEGRQYAVLSPAGEEDAWIYRFVPREVGEFKFEDIDSEEEFEAVCKAYDDLSMEAELDTVFDENK